MIYVFHFFQVLHRILNDSENMQSSSIQMISARDSGTDLPRESCDVDQLKKLLIATHP